jgi:hypothetical protein
MELAERLRLELNSCRRVQQVLNELRATLEAADEVAEVQELTELLAIKRQRIASLKSRLSVEQ